MGRVFVYEHVTATTPKPDPADSLYREGRAMRDAIIEDLQAVPGLEVVSFSNDATIKDFDSLVRTCDAALIVAPELEGILESLVRRVEAVGVPLLGPSAEAIKLTADKIATTSWWKSHGIASPFSELACDWSAIRVPCVIKPRDGAGSTATYYCHDVASFLRSRQDAYDHSPSEPIACDYVEGFAVSVSFLIGPVGVVPLLPTFQHVSPQTHFRYDGGELPIPPKLARHAVALGSHAISCVPGLHGYVGVDLVLGDAEDGTQDFAIEINPRLTTSYVGLRGLANTNLAGAFLDVCSGKVPGRIDWKPGRIRFRADGSVDYAAI